MLKICSNDVDVVVFSVYDKAYNHCQDEPVGTYVTPVTYYVNGLVNQEIQDMQDQGYNYYIPDVAQYVYCTAFEIQNQVFFFQLGCADDSTQKLAVNIYEDNECTKRSKNADGYDDSNLDVSALGVRVRVVTSTSIFYSKRLLINNLYLIPDSSFLTSVRLVSTGLIWMNRLMINTSKRIKLKHLCARLCGAINKIVLENVGAQVWMLLI